MDPQALDSLCAVLRRHGVTRYVQRGTDVELEFSRRAPDSAEEAPGERSAKPLPADPAKVAKELGVSREAVEQIAEFLGGVTNA